MALAISEVHFAQESAFATDPDSDGSDYKALNAEGLVLPVDDTPMQETNFATGRGDPTGALRMGKSAAIQLEWPLTGCSAAAGDGDSPPAMTAQEYIIESALGASATIAGEGLAAGGSTTSVVLDTDLAGLTVEDLMCINYGSPAHSEWRPVTVDNASATYTVGPALSASPDAARVAYGSRVFVPVKGGTTLHLACHCKIGGTGYTQLGGRPTSLKVKAEAGKIATMSAAIRFNSRTAETKASLPAISQFTNPGIKQTVAQMYWGSTAFALRSVEIDFGLSTMEVRASSGAEGRAGFMVTKQHPRITIEPAFAASWETDLEAETKRAILVQIGSGELLSSRVSTWCFYAAAAQIKKVDWLDDAGYLRQKIVIDVVDAGIRTGTTAYRLFTLAQA